MQASEQALFMGWAKKSASEANLAIGSLFAEAHIGACSQAKDSCIHDHASIRYLRSSRDYEILTELYYVFYKRIEVYLKRV